MISVSVSVNMGFERSIMNRIILAAVSAASVLSAGPCRAQTMRDVACSGAITMALQNAVSRSMDGDTVNIGPGNCSSGKISWSNKNITVRGQGKDVTTINFAAGGFAVTMTNTAKATWRISSMTMQGTASSDHVLFINSERAPAYTSGWRVDNIRFNYTGAVANDPIVGWGMTFGVFDHNDFAFANATWILFAGFQTSKGEQTWGSPAVDKVGGWYNLSLPSQYGTANAIYFEDNTFTARSNYNAFFDSSSGGSRVVFRRNVFTGGFLYNHWVRGNDLDAFQWEVYNNRFVGTAKWGRGSGEIPARFESGTGVFYNNTVTGYAAGNMVWAVDERRGVSGGETGGQFGTCDGSRPWDGNAGDPAAPGWPCLGQIGRGFGKTYAQITAGDKLPSLPAYAWNNGAQDKCADATAAGADCVDSVRIANYLSNDAYVKSSPHPNGEVDVVNGTPMPGYLAFTYPHPLVGRHGQAP